MERESSTDIMAASSSQGTCEFDRLLTKSVPHIFEKIFFSLDHESFKNCRDVCKAWKELFSSKRYRRREKTILQEERNLLRVSKVGNAAEVMRLLMTGVSPNFKDHNGMTPLLAVAKKGDKNMIKMLLDRGAQPNAIDKNGKTPLTVAVYHDHKDVANLLLSRGADPNAGKYYGRATLTWAVIRSNVETVQQCLDGGADPNMMDEKSGKPIIQIALEKGTSTVNLLLDSGAHHNSVLLWAVKYGFYNLHSRLVQQCLERGADINKAVDERGLNALCIAVERNDQYWVRLLLKMGASRSTALSYAVPKSTLDMGWNKRIDYINMLLQQRLNNMLT